MTIITGDGYACSDVNECLEFPCDRDEGCQNLVGSHKCVPCPAGHTSNGSQCMDIDECSTGTHLCHRVGCIVDLVFEHEQKPIFSWQRVPIRLGAMLVNVIRVLLAMVYLVKTLMNAVQINTIALISQFVLILKVAIRVLVTRNMSQEDIEEVVGEATAVK